MSVRNCPTCLILPYLNYFCNFKIFTMMQKVGIFKRTMNVHQTTFSSRLIIFLVIKQLIKKKEFSKKTSEIAQPRYSVAIGNRGLLVVAQAIRPHTGHASRCLPVLGRRQGAQTFFEQFEITEDWHLGELKMASRRTQRIITQSFPN